MRSTSLCAFLLLLRASCRCMAVSRDYVLDREHPLCKTGKEDGQMHCTMSVDPIEDIPVEVGVYPKSPDVPLPSIPTSSSTDLLASSAVMPSMSRVFAASLTLPIRIVSRISTGNAFKEKFHPEKRHRNAARQNPVAITFGILGATIGVVILILCGRSVHHYYRTPRRDLVVDHIDRYNLERELAEIERRRLGIIASPEGNSLFQPPPPYIHAPKYEDATKDQPVIINHP